MYVYFFGYQNNNELYFMPVDFSKYNPWDGDCRLMDVYVKESECTVPYKQKLMYGRDHRRYTVSKNEGTVYRRTFWLKEHDIHKAYTIKFKYEHQVEESKKKLTHAEEVKMLKDQIDYLGKSVRHLRKENLKLLKKLREVTK